MNWRRDWADKRWLEVKRDPDRIVFWALAVMFMVGKAHGWI